MLSCKKCIYNDCDCKADLLKALDLLSVYIPTKVINKIEDIVEDSLDVCPDYKERQYER